MQVELTDLRLFAAVVRAGSITGGAAAVNLALASASARVSGMEARLGVALLERAARGVRPTAAGVALLRHAQDILARSSRLAEEMRGYATGLRGRVRLLSNTGALLGFLPDALRGFLRAHPGLDVALEEQPSAAIVRIVTEGGAELGVVADVVEPGGLMLRRLHADRLVLVVAASDKLADRAEVAFAEVLGLPFVGLLDAALERHLAEHAARHGARLSHRVRLRSVGAIGRMVADGIGVAVLPQSAEAALEGAAVRCVPLSDSWASVRRAALCYRDEASLTPHARLLMEHLAAA